MRDREPPDGAVIVPRFPVITATAVAGIVLVASLFSLVVPQLSGQVDPTANKPREWYLDVVAGKVPGHRIIKKFGTSAVTTTLAPVTFSGFYRTPTAATALEFVSSSTDDDVGGIGAQEVTIIGLDSTWHEVTQTLATDGTTPVPLSTDLIRLYRWKVTISGTYASQAAGSHVGTLTIREAGAGVTWSTIGLVGGLGRGQSVIGAYTVPAGKTAYILSSDASVDAAKSVNYYFFERCNADDVTTPYTGTMLGTLEVFGLKSPWAPPAVAPRGPYPGPCDIGFLAQVALTTADASVNFEILLIDD